MSPAKARKNRVVPSPRDIGSGSGHTQDPARDAEKLSGTGEGWHYGTNDPKDVGNRLGKGEAVSGMSVRTSKTHPIRVDFVNQRDLRLSGKLGMTLAPGLKDDNAKAAPGSGTSMLTSDS